MNNFRLQTNQRNWDKTYSQFKGWCALPSWGPFEVGKDNPSLIGKIKDKTFLEICCGSGHSIKYLVERGAKQVYALDISSSQIKLARETNQEHLGKIRFLHGPMEQRIQIPEKVDVVYSIYGIGWTMDPKAMFKSIYSYLKPGGKFVWSWDHGVFLNSEERGGKIITTGSYFNESIRYFKSFHNGAPAYQALRKTSTWFQLLKDAGFEIQRYLEPEPLNLRENISRISGAKMGHYYSPKKASHLPTTIIFECIKK